jgi:hypothetical protein
MQLVISRSVPIPPPIPPPYELIFCRIKQLVITEVEGPKLFIPPPPVLALLSVISQDEISGDAYHNKIPPP